MELKKMNTKKDRILEIQKLYNKLPFGTKGSTRRELADHINEFYEAKVIQSNTIKNHWFTDEWVIPIPYQNMVISFLTEKIENQNQSKNA